MKRITDDAIIAAVLECGTITAAAAKLHCSRHTIHDRMKEPGFASEYHNRKFQIMSGAFLTMAGNIDKACATISEIMDDKETAAAVRLQAAQTILKHTAQFFSALEEMAIPQAKDEIKPDALSAALTELAKSLESDQI